MRIDLCVIELRLIKVGVYFLNHPVPEPIEITEQFCHFRQ